MLLDSHFLVHPAKDAVNVGVYQIQPELDFFSFPERMLKVQLESQAIIRETTTCLVEVADTYNQDEANIHFISIHVMDRNLTPRLPIS